MADMILFIGFLILVLLILTITVKLARRGIHLLADPPLNLTVFLLAKILALVSCLFIPLGVFWPELK